MKLLFITFIALLVGACTTSSKNAQNNNQDTIYNLALEALGEERIEFNYNENRDFLLATSKDEQEGQIRFKYVVMDVSQKNIVDEGNLPLGKAKWISDYEIEIIAPPGIIRDNSESLSNYTKILNVKTGEKTSKKAAQF
ncbi:hypothetical protein [Marivirga sp.]|uniref:hypothetical protein n=1 Tax=Marivirga sp. TaxID=2018662 RepID=UPI002D80F88E|nr:hypothetical protein [Marivirga sp.]HET8861298.1 hypothetical protein [Marivirga sp.]